MRGQRPAYRVGRSDSRVTGTASGANLAAMLSILQAVIGTPRSALRPRASLVAENVVLRQQLAILRRATPRPRRRPIDRAVNGQQELTHYGHDELTHRSSAAVGQAHGFFSSFGSERFDGAGPRSPGPRVTSTSAC
jgi:hypothetical protein